MFTTMFFSKHSLLRWLTAGTFLFFIVQPYGFQNNESQLATGASLRYANAAIILGLVGILPYIRRFGVYSTVSLTVLAYMQVVFITNIFRADSTTLMCYDFAFGIMVAIVVDRVFTSRIVTSLIAMSMVAYAVVLVGSHPVDYYNDGCSHAAYKCTFFSWLSATRPRGVISDTLLLGSVVEGSPSTSIENASPDQSCVQARRHDAWLVIKRSAIRSVATEVQERDVLKSCGTTIYHDAEFTVLDPTHFTSERR